MQTAIYNAQLASIYPLKKSTLLDLKTNIPIFNDLSRLINAKAAADDKFVVLGNTTIPILTWKNVNLILAKEKGPITFKIHGTTYYKGFAYNLIPLNLF